MEDEIASMGEAPTPLVKNLRFVRAKLFLWAQHLQRSALLSEKKKKDDHGKAKMGGAFGLFKSQGGEENRLGGGLERIGSVTNHHQSNGVVKVLKKSGQRIVERIDFKGVEPGGPGNIFDSPFSGGKEFRWNRIIPTQGVA